LHVHGYKAGILARLPARILGIPVVTTFHSGERSRARLGLYESADEYTSFLGERICVSAAIQARLPFPATLIKNFVPDSAAPSKNALPRRAAFVGRLTREKGPDIFCEIASRHVSAAEWHVYGDGPMRQELQERFGHIVNFHGLVPDLGSVWPTIGLLVMPSRFEGLPYAALEALSAGIPVLAARVGGLPEAVREPETGWMFEAGNVTEASSKVDAWAQLSVAEQEAMRMRCWNHAQNCFSESSEMSKLLSVYRKAGYPP
jgi:glycosyltransferase involved in cell wall biosynthesis